MSRPRVLLLDEPAAGMNPQESLELMRVIRRLRDEFALTILLVEQNAFHALRLAHRGYVLVNGKIAMTGGGQELLANEQIRSAYLEGGHGR